MLLAPAFPRQTIEVSGGHQPTGGVNFVMAAWTAFLKSDLRQSGSKSYLSFAAL
jgi:hypothetical protein